MYVKVPVTNSRGVPAYDVMHRLSHAGVKINVTAAVTLERVGCAGGCDPVSKP